MKHNLRRVLRLTEARTFWVRATRAWRQLLPDWTPTLDDLKALETMPHEHRAAVGVVSDGWDSNSPKWDVLMALLEWERREATLKASYDTRLAAWEESLLEDGNICDHCLGVGHSFEDCPSDEPPVGAVCPCGQCADTGCHHDPCLIKKADAMVVQERDADPATTPVKNLTFHQPLDEDIRAALFAKFRDEPGDPLGRHLELVEDDKPIVVPVKLVTGGGQVLSMGETTVETPVMASFLDRLTPVKHLREKNDA